MKRVLIIEDDEELLELVDYIIIGCGYKVITSAKKLCVEDIYSLNPNLIIIDHYLSEGLGGDLCSELKSNEATKRIPVIMMSVSSRLNEIAGSSCADAYISKPFDVNDFEALIESLIEVQGKL